MRLWQCKKCRSLWEFRGSNAKRVGIDFEKYPEYENCALCRERIIEFEQELIQKENSDKQKRDEAV